MNNAQKSLLTIGILFLVILSVSFIYSSFIKTDSEPVRILYNEKGEAVAKAPFPPSLAHPLGTDKVGNDLGLRLIEGAKYTILFITGVAFLRVISSILFTYFLVFPLSMLYKWVEVVFIPFQYIPALILVFLLSPELNAAVAQMGFVKVVLYQFSLFVFIGIPVLSMLFVKESRTILEKEYVAASTQLGASHWHIYTKHILPVLKARIIQTLLQQLSINMLLLIQLGVFQYFIGGSKPGNIAAEGEPPKFLSESGEWAGMIGLGKDEFLREPWIFFSPLLVSVIFLMTIKVLANRIHDNG